LAVYRAVKFDELTFGKALAAAAGIDVRLAFPVARQLPPQNGTSFDPAKSMTGPENWFTMGTLPRVRSSLRVTTCLVFFLQCRINLDQNIPQGRN
jgi:hypothetical protein